MFDTSPHRWHPIAASSDLVSRHVFHGQLLGREFAVWRADDGFVNVWENRCLHRGVRLSIGINDGRELKCQYHGWRYANRTAGCTYIPAHPADAPARTITNRTFAAVERYGMVWSAEQPEGEVPAVAGMEEGGQLVLRPIPLNASADRVVEHLKSYAFAPSAALDAQPVEMAVEGGGAFSVALLARADGAATRAAFFVQPVDSGRSVIRGMLDALPDGADRVTVLRHHNQRLTELRERIEREAARLPAPEPMQPAIVPVSAELAEMPELTPSGRKAALRVQVARKWQAAEGIAALELRTVNGVLPTFQPGAHIDLHLPNGLVRQYSITNGPGETDRYVIGVKREAASGGGSACVHDTLRVGDVLAISEPRNNFPLRRDAVRTLFIAGGIGITPLLSMALALDHSALSYRLHYFAQAESQMAFADRLAELKGNLVPHLGLSPEATQEKLRETLSGYVPGMHVYLCGPGPMLEAARAIARDCGWPESAVHFEYFKNTHEIDDSSSFEVALARSCVTLQVPAGRTILDVMREAGIDMPSSCEQGACGTCLATVIEGEPDHQDVYLNDAEKRSNTKIMTCVSRAKSARLVLDL
ncbi:Rieske 2Fe-2S domain-containing protein [Chelativorans sp. ZYF759]|uniref:Rieske 2Fe-2S domain-containing protein n=1 Tax=Chelativorans sp. ZYF759 TaxID=2692213 RepID=UPI00145D9B44|nr:Rieske 2Fe-2S domain-containing protein [Chelativorans sp. ZYF759]NMG40933.1 Rieske 2Fe-2S domain-containing protein [Chelativorans sp. ZYF759]